MSDTQTRLCLVDGKKATFHRWSVKTELFIKVNAMLTHEEMIRRVNLAVKEGVIPPYCDTETIQRTVAIVEYDDGTVAEVEPIRIKFTRDHMVDDYIKRSTEVL